MKITLTEVKRSVASPRHTGTIFKLLSSKPYRMPNSANRKAGNNKAGTGHKEDVNKQSDTPKPNPERSDVKNGDRHKDHPGDTGRSSSQGRKEASGGRPDE